MTSLRLRMMEDMQVRNLSRHAQDSYLLQVSQFARHFAKSPDLLGPEDIHAYQVYLTNEKKLAPRSVRVIVAALRFLYRVTLGLDWDFNRIWALLTRLQLKSIPNWFSKIQPQQNAVFESLMRD